MLNMPVTLILFHILQFFVIETPIGIIIRVVRIGGADEPAIKLVESPVQRSSFRIKTVQMPFIHQASSVTGGSEHGSNCCVIRLKMHTTDRFCTFQSLNAAGSAKVIANGSITGILTRHQRATGRRTNAGTGITLGKSGSRSRQAIYVGSLYVFIPITCQVTIPHIIG